MQILIVCARCLLSSCLSFHGSLSYSVLIILCNMRVLNFFMFLGHRLQKILDSILKLDFQIVPF